MLKRISIAAAALLLAGCGTEEQAKPQAGFKFDPANFVEKIDNPYWPMAPGSRWVYSEVDTEGRQRVEVTVTGKTKVVAGVRARVVRDVVTDQRGRLVEDTDDWYAQDKDGNVWYLGEDTTEYENGKPVTRKGSWEAGVDGATAGVIMPARPRVGMAYQQELYRGEAEDRARVLSLDDQAEVRAGHFTNVLMTKDYTPLEPEVLEYKLYAKGVGPVLILSPSGGAGGREELLSFDKGSG